MKAVVKFLAFSIVMFIGYFEAEAQTLTLKFTNIRNSAGVFRIGIYIDEDSYKNGDPAFYRTASKENVKDGMLNVKYDDLKSGIYGIVVLDDENSNDKTDFGIILPDEGFGFSNYIIDKLCAPDFSDFSFILNYDKTVTIRITYLLR